MNLKTMKRPLLRVLLATPHLPESEGACAPQHILQEIRYLAKIKKLELIVVTSDSIDYKIPGLKFVRTPSQPKYKANFSSYLNFLIKAPPKLPLSYRRWVWEYWWQGFLDNLWIADLVRKYGVDIIHSHWFFPRCTGAVYAGRACSVPVIITARGSDILKDKTIEFGWRLAPHRDRLIKAALNMADAVTVASKDSLDAVEEVVGLHDKLRLIPNGVDLSLFKFDMNCNELRSRLLAGSSFLVLSVGDLKRGKGHDILIRSIRMLREKNLSVKLVIIGEGPEHRNLSNLIKELSLQDFVEILGGRVFQELPKYYAAGDCFALASFKEGFGNVFLEALAMRRPLVVTPVGFVRDFLSEGVQARIVPVKDPVAMAEAMYDVLKHPERSKDMAKRGYDLVRSRFTIEARIKSFHDLYLEQTLRR